MKDYYKILGVDRDVSPEELKKVYRKLSMQYHPDRQAGKSPEEQKEAEEKFKEISEAYSVLSDPQKKQEWEMGGQSFNFSGDPFSMFDDFFVKSQVKGASLQAQVTISLIEALTGVTKKLKYKREVICPKCQGRGAINNSDIQFCTTCSGTGQVYRQVGPWQQISTCPNCQGKGRFILNPCPKCGGRGLAIKEEVTDLNIPPLPHSTVFTSENKGSECINGIPGDLHVIINIETPDKFKIEENGVVSQEITVDIIDAILGCDIEIIDIEGKTLRGSIKPGTKEGHILRVANRGLYFKGKRADMLLVIKHSLPTNLSEKQINLLQEFKNESNQT